LDAINHFTALNQTLAQNSSVTVNASQIIILSNL